MYIESSWTYYDYDGTQHSRRARFLILADDKEQICNQSSYHGNLYGCVRKVALSQLGHFMMGRAKVGDSMLTLSGTYGGDGLPAEEMEKLTERTRKEFKLIPPELTEAFWHDKNADHSSSSRYVSERLREWALTQ